MEEASTGSEKMQTGPEKTQAVSEKTHISAPASHCLDGGLSLVDVDQNGVTDAKAQVVVQEHLEAGLAGVCHPRCCRASSGMWPLQPRVKV